MTARGCPAYVIRSVTCCPISYGRHKKNTNAKASDDTEGSIREPRGVTEPLPVRSAERHKVDSIVHQWTDYWRLRRDRPHHIPL